MADKKKKGNKDKKDADAAPDASKPGAAGTGLDPVTVELYELKIKDLLDKVDKTKEKQKLLVAENETLLKVQTKSVSEKQDIVEFLRIELANHERTLADAEDRLHALEQEQQYLLRMHASELDAKDQVLNEERETLQAKIARLTAELQELTEFRGRKAAMERDLAQLVSDLDDKERAYHADVTSMERKYLQDKHALKREMAAKVADAVGSFRRVADTQMAETTKRALRENLVATAQLRKLATKTSEIMAENDALKEANTKLRIDAEILRNGQTQLARKASAAHQVIRRLLDKLDRTDSCSSSSGSPTSAAAIDADDHRLLKAAVPYAEFHAMMAGRTILEAPSITSLSPARTASSPARGGTAPSPAPTTTALTRSPPPRRGLPTTTAADTSVTRDPPPVAPVEWRAAQAHHARALAVLDQVHAAVASLAELLTRVYADAPPARRARGANTDAAAVPPVVRRFVNDLRGHRAQVVLHYPRAVSPVGPPLGRDGEEGVEGADEDVGKRAASAPASPRGQGRGGAAAAAGPVSTRKNVHLDLLLPHLPLPKKLV
ncbi:hypothetical protein AMAG_06826 [Allomyces macrogynus ATCC 38327]|uniref:Cilia- and flagella-associated protein 157 n=1 Tax=Allomyces macrogynus (strain ATCC 38327) TaxID=578462 RepID=A0A0L0SEZ3_ALLM3|nr:hypothetical protein AMAG_06826 [Allomyces macrogynus ATCC 38327]|eukprot:KNE61071.1 hypothetical protein AMAG_06826 [Allomyces macrogynus ATCC 38327]